MDKNTQQKRSTIQVLNYKVVLSLIFFVLEVVKFEVTAQIPGQDSIKYWKLNITDDHFWEPNCPTPSSIIDGYNLWLLRQKMTIEAYQTILNNEINLENGNLNKIQFTNYMPLLSANNFNSMIGTQYSKSEILSDNEFNLNKSIQMVWLWTAWQYKYKRWTFSLTSENSFRGDENTLYAKTGNRNLLLAYVGYEFNNRWELIVLGRCGQQQMVGESRDLTIFGVQARYQPSSKFKILFGVPTLFAAEWTALSNTDIGMKFMFTTESQLFIRQRIAKSISITIQYYSSLNNSNETYFNNASYSLNTSSTVTFNNISYLQHQLFASVDLKLYKDIGFSIGCGYNLSSKMSLYNNNAMVYNGIKSKDNFFINCTLQFIRLK